MSLKIETLDQTDRIFQALLNYVFRRQSRQPLNELTPDALTKLLVAIAAAGMGRHFPPKYAHEWANQCLFRMSEFSLAELASVVKAFQRLRMSPQSGHFMTRLFTTYPELEKLTGQSLQEAVKRKSDGLPAIIS